MRIPRFVLTAAIAGAGTLACSGAATADSLNFIYYDATYSGFEQSSPWADSHPSDFFVETFEDGKLNMPGVTASNGSVRSPGSGTDSVDADGDGVLDGMGDTGHSFVASGNSSTPVTMRFEFDGESFGGGLPTHAGLVWTDGKDGASFTFEAFDENGVSLGSVTKTLGDDGPQGSTAEDQFLGVVFSEGISAIEIRSDFGTIEVDHLQYGGSFGGAVVPLPGPVYLGLAGLGIIAFRRRRRGGD